MSTVDFACLGPVGRSATEVRFIHLVAVFWLIPYKAYRLAPSEKRNACAYRKSNPDILVVQSAQDRATENASNCLGGA